MVNLTLEAAAGPGMSTCGMSGKAWIGGHKAGSRRMQRHALTRRREPLTTYARRGHFGHSPWPKAPQAGLHLFQRSAEKVYIETNTCFEDGMKIPPQGNLSQNFLRVREVRA